jgi:hypothetical protein
MLSSDLLKIEAKADSEDSEVPVFTAGKYLKDNNLVFEQIEGQTFFCSNGKIVDRIPSKINSLDVAYVPIPLGNINWNLCSASPIEPVNKNKLWSFVRNFIYKSVELPDERLYDVLTAWVFATWVPELWEVSPYVFFVGVKNSGKTRALEALQQISFRAKISVSSTAPALFRSIEKYGCLPFIDESETLNNNEKVDVVACLNAGYKRCSGMVERCQGENKNQDIVTFHVFGFKGIAGTESLRSTLESRSIIINMAKNTRQLDFTINTNAAKLIRNGLLLWRFETLTSNQNACYTTKTEETLTYNSFETYEECDAKTKPVSTLPKQFEEIKNGRVIELFTPLYTVALDEVKPVIFDYAKTVAAQQKTEENTSIESDILLAILECSDLVEMGVLPYSVVENTFNQDKPEKERLYGVRLSKKINSLGLQSGRTSKKRGLVWNTEKLRQLCVRFGFDPDAYLPPEPSNKLLASASGNASFASSASSTQLQPQPVTPTKTSFQPPDFSKNRYENVVSFNALLPSEIKHEKCVLCGWVNNPLIYRATMNDGRTLEICERCGEKVAALSLKQEGENSQ